MLSSPKLSNFVDRRWYVIEFDDGKFKKNYVCQLIGESGDSELVVNSYLKVNSSKNYQIGRLFKKYPVEEDVLRSQFLKMLPTPDFKNVAWPATRVRLRGVPSRDRGPEALPRKFFGV